MKNLFLILLMIFLTGCAAVKEIPVTDYEKIVYRDSTVYITDTVEVPIPTYIEKVVVPQDTSSVIQGNLSRSEAFIRNGQLNHSLEEKGSVKVVYDTVVTVQYVDRIVERDKIVEVEVEKKYIPDWCYWSLIFNVIILCFLAFKIYLKFKK